MAAWSLLIVFFAFCLGVRCGRLDEKWRCFRVAEDEPNLPGPIPPHVLELVERAIKNGKLEEICRHFAGSMQKSISKKIQES